MGGVGVVEGGGRLVQDEELDVLGEGLGDLHELLLADADVLDLGVGVLVQPYLRQDLPGLLTGFHPIDDASGGYLVAEVEVLDDRQFGDQRELLVDDRDARVLRLSDVTELDKLVVEMDLAFVRTEGVYAGQHLHQRRLTGAVLADDAMNLAPLHLEGHVLKGLHPRELLRDPPHGEDRVCHGFSFRRLSVRCACGAMDRSARAP